MSEQATQQSIELEPPAVSSEAAYAWIDNDAEALNGTIIQYDRGRGAEDFTLQDALHIRFDPHSSDNKEKYPGLILQSSEGQSITVDARDYLQQAGFDEASYLAKISAKDRLAVEQAWASSLEQNKPYYKMLFNPIERPSTQDTDSYDPTTKKISRSIATYENSVTDTNRADSAELLTEVLQRDTGLFKVIESFQDQIDVSEPTAVVDAIRTNQELRFAVGMYYVDKIHWAVTANPEAFGDQVRNDTQKLVQIMSHVTTTRSRDNVALICLAKLDGSFAGRDPITNQKIDSATLNTHHRPAADYVLAA